MIRCHVQQCNIRWSACALWPSPTFRDLVTSICFTYARRNMWKLLKYLIPREWKKYSPLIRKWLDKLWDTQTLASCAANNKASSSALTWPRAASQFFQSYHACLWEPLLYPFSRHLQCPTQYQAPCPGDENITMPWKRTGQVSKTWGWQPTKQRSKGRDGLREEQQSFESLGIWLRSWDSVLGYWQDTM